MTVLNKETSIKTTVGNDIVDRNFELMLPDCA